jgi:glycosyltransferase involved in cell wall biosynthesis
MKSSLSIIIPAYNEEKTVASVIKKVLKNKLVSEVIVVNDGSNDNTKFEIKNLKSKKLKVLNKIRNEGKGAAIRDGIKLVTGKILVIQDADLEYDPNEYGKLVKPILDKKADVVFGSRFLGNDAHRVLYFWHMVGNQFLTLLTNIVTNLNLTDMETCYKAFTIEVANRLDINEKRFGFEPEFTVKVAKMGARIYEVGISYYGRNYEEGKKISWKDGIMAIGQIIKHGFSL